MVLDTFVKSNNKVLGWWTFLIIISIFNILFISIYAFTHKLNNKQLLIFVFAFIFSIVCAIRSFYPTKYTEKTCFLKTKYYTPFVIRVLATVAELTYILLFVYIFIYIIKNIKSIANINLDYLKKYVYLVIPIVILAEVFSWLGSITEYQLWNVSEEILWFLSSIILIVISLYILKNIKHIKTNKIRSIYYLLSGIVPIATIFATFMIVVDIPMYIRRWIKGEKIKSKSLNQIFNEFKIKHRKNFDNKINDFRQCKKVDKSLNTWKNEIPWLTGYFTIGVWTTFVLAIWFKHHSD